jgi:7,8-dihydropterin-6-yl-methyl-4-(beta-D-ribofuranosyl)aminobenzene 5'-phosphate synthase
MTPTSKLLDLQVLDELIVTVVVDNATDALSSIGPEIPQLSEIFFLLNSVPPTRQHKGRDCITVFDQMCMACHGLSVLISGRRGAEVRTALIDAGPNGEVWLDNARRLGIDLAAIDILFLSHWHWDHSGGIPTVVDAISKAKRGKGIRMPVMVDVHPDRPDRRGIQLPGGPMVMLPDEPTIDAIENSGGHVVPHRDAHLFGDAFFGSSGMIARTTAYETGLPGHHSFQGDHGFEDPLISDERLVLANVRGRGISVFSACSHAGIVNACLQAQVLVPGIRVDLVLGGYHLAGATVEDRISSTAEDLADLINPRIVAPGHCTGWRANSALAERFAPNAFAPSVVGARYVLTSKPPNVDSPQKDVQP